MIATPVAWIPRLVGAGDASELELLPGGGDATKWLGTELSEVSCLLGYHLAPGLSVHVLGGTALWGRLPSFPLSR